MNHHLLRISPGSSNFSEQLQCLAKVLWDCDGDVRSEVCKSFGLVLELSGKLPSLTYLGQRSGRAQLRTPTSIAEIEVVPKNPGIDLSELLSAAAKRGSTENYGALIGSFSSGVGGESSEFSFAYLLGLLNDIKNLGTHAFEIYNGKHRELRFGSPAGRLVPRSFVINQIKGENAAFECELINNEQFRKYACVFFYTALSICRRLSHCLPENSISGVRLKETERLVRSRLGTYVVHKFSLPLVVTLSKPPYPFGMRELVLSCLKYWLEWRKLSGEKSNRPFSFEGHYLRVDKLFEDYVGIIFEEALGEDFSYLPRSAYSYGSQAGIFRSIEPDHVYVNHTKRQILIAEAKYSNDIARRDNLAQLLAYISYRYPKWSDFTSFGFLVYPGDVFEAFAISEFSRKVEVCRVSSNFVDMLAQLRARIEKVLN